MPILDNLNINTTFLSKCVPKFAKCAQRCNRLCQIIGELPFVNMTGFKVFGLSCVEAANLIAKLNKRVLSKFFDKVTGQVMSKGSKLSKFLSPEELEFADNLPDVTVSIKDLKQQEKDGFTELKEDFKAVKSQLSGMEDMLISLHHLPGCSVITRSYNALMDSVDLDFWGQNFQSFVAEFENSLGDFREENLTQLFQKVYKGRCESSWDPLFQTFNHLWTCRSMYFYIKCKFFHHLPSTVVVDLEKLIQNEMTLYERDASILENAAETVTGGFFMAGLTCDRSWNLQLAVDKSEENLLAEKTIGELFYGDKTKNTAPAKLYKIPGEQHVYVHNTKYNNESIHALREDGLLQDGLHRYRYPSGDTHIGCRLFWRGDRIEHRENKLFRFSSSGEIEYKEQVWGKDKAWRTVTSFRYYPDTFSWEKINIELRLLNRTQLLQESSCKV